MSWTKEELQAYEVKRSKWGKDLVQECEDIPDPGPESDLQSKIFDWCRQRGYPCFHDYSRKKNMAGWPDLTIVMEGPRVLFVELKAEKGPLRKAQRDLKQVFAWLKHDYHVVRSFKRFLEVVNNDNKQE